MMDTTFNELSRLLKQPAFTTKEANKLGVSSSLLTYYYKTGKLDRLARGIYKSSDKKLIVPMEWEDVAITAKSIPQGIICLLTALTYYELTDEFAREIWIAVPRKSRAPKRENARIVQMSNIKLGLKKIKLGDFSVKIFDRERTIVDSFRLLSKEIAIKALKSYLKSSDGGKSDLRKLHRYAKEIRIDISPYIEALII